jgi:hypothetical protein
MFRANSFASNPDLNYEPSKREVRQWCFGLEREGRIDRMADLIAVWVLAGGRMKGKYHGA